MSARALTHLRAAPVAVLAASLVLVAASSTGASAAPGVRAAVIGGTDWPAYERGSFHTSRSSDSTITATNVSTLHVAWSFKAAAATQTGQPAPKFDASPTVAGGLVYIGARTGVLYALNASTGAVVWQTLLDWGSNALCPARGIIGTATVANDPSTGVLTVYAVGAHYLYALDAASGARRWRTAIGPDTTDGNNRYFNWGSPTVIGGKVFIGLAAGCEADLIRGGVVELDQHTGALQHTYFAVRAGTVGASVWSSLAGDGTSVWVTTGNPDPTGTTVDDAYSIVRLSASTLARQEAWTVPASITADLDFGSSPTLFHAVVGGVSTKLVAACNKNGLFYAWRQTNLAAGPVWQRRVGQSAAAGGSCLTSAAYDSSSQRLFVGANQTTIGGQTVPGSIRALNPSTGAVLWGQPLGCRVTGSPTLAGATHVLAVPLYACSGTAHPGVALFNATTGAPLRTLTAAANVFAQPIMAEGHLYIADESGTLSAYIP